MMLPRHCVVSERIPSSVHGLSAILSGFLIVFDRKLTKTSGKIDDFSGKNIEIVREFF